MANAVSEIDLIGGPGGDPLFDLLDLSPVVPGGQVEGDLVFAEGWRALCNLLRRQRGQLRAAEEACVVVKDDGLAVDAEAAERQIARALVRRCLAASSRSVAEEAGDEAACGEGGFDLRE